MRRPLLLALSAALAAGYPFAIWAGLLHLDPRLLGLLLAGALGVRGAFALRHADPASRRRVLGPLLAVAALVVGAALLDAPRGFLLLPVAISLLLGAAFARTLLRPGPSMVETFARLQVGELPPEEVRYCARVTAVWCGFFAANAAVAGWLAFGASLRAWALWCGLLSYAAMALLLGGELVYRYWRFRRYAGAPTDPFFRPFFPPRPPPPDGPAYGSAPER